MTLLQSIILGALQGVAEFLPISSSGHLVVFRNFMDLGNVPVLFDILLHVSTLLVVFIVFRKIIGRLIVSLFRLLTGRKDDSDRENLRLIAIVLGASVFTAVLGFAIESLDVGSRPRVVSALFLVTAAVLFFTRFIRKEGRSYGEHGLKTAVITGVAQGIAVLPGISRSGMTIAASLYSGISREKAGEYSFILSLPAILGALLLEIKDLGALNEAVSVPVVAAGMLSAFIVGMVSILSLLKLLEKRKLHYFCFYLVPFAVISFILL